MAATQPPPQAYTKETVAQAYQWLFSQPPQVREIAGDLDSMVALFLQSKRRRANAGLSTNPVSAKAFKDELKGLAENFKQFEPTQSSSTQISMDTTGPTQTPQAQISQHMQQMVQESLAAPQPPIQPPQQPIQTQVIQPTQAPMPQIQTPVPPPASFQPTQQSLPITAKLDEKSLQQIHQVMESFNLSSESETLRLIISLGYEKVREILPKG